MSLTIWASASNIPITVCRDARLRKDKDDSTRSGLNTPHGQAGWDVGLNFGSLRNLVDQLETSTLPANVCGNSWMDCERAQPKSISRLAINAHGAPGKFDVLCGRGISPGTGEFFSKDMMTADNIGPKSQFGPDLLRILNLMATNPQPGFPAPAFLLMGCQAGAGAEGTRFVVELSKVLSACLVVAFATIGFSSAEQQKRATGDVCTEPGMRDTDYERQAGLISDHEEYNRYFRDRQWWDLKKLPWASELSPHAKAAQGGKILWGHNL
jgi:hypothetical protein